MESEGHLGLEACLSWVQALATGFLGGLNESLPLPELCSSYKGLRLVSLRSPASLGPLMSSILACSAL